MAMVWTEDRINKARQMVREGYDASEVADCFGTTRKAVLKAHERIGFGPWVSKRGKPSDEPPADFAERYAKHTLRELGLIYKCRAAHAGMWAKKLGIARGRQEKVPEPAVVVPIMPPERVAEAVKFLRFDRGVSRCDSDGRSNHEGKFWKVGTLPHPMTDAEIIDAAAEKKARDARLFGRRAA